MSIAQALSTRQRRRPLVFISGAVLVVLSLAYLVYGGIQQGATYWVTVGELEQRTAAVLPDARLAILPDAVQGRKPAPAVLPDARLQRLPSRVRLGGTVAPGSVRWDASHRHLRFVITDGEHSLPVAYSGVVPDIFSEGRQVVVEGAVGRDGAFEATTLLAKCPTKYTPADPQTPR